jgi:hypothetical protein
MQKSTKKTLKYVGIGALGLYVLRKLDLGNLGGDILTEGVTGIMGGIVDVVTEIPQAIVSGVTETIVRPTAENVSSAAYRVGTGQGGWQDYLWSFSPLGGFGASAGLANALSHQYQPTARHIEPNSGYITASMLTNISPAAQPRAATIQRLLQSYSPGDAAYVLAMQEGRDVSNWNMSGLTSAFKAQIGVT